jgi:predicted nucleic acid-binding protein
MSEGKQGRCFIDTNIWLYAFLETQSNEKSTTAKSVISEKNITMSTQVINEVCVNLIKKVHFSEQNIQKLIISFYAKYTVIEITRGILLKASELRGQNRLSFWDSVIVASALYSNIDILYSEDMQDGLVVENKLRIINPFQNT